MSGPTRDERERRIERDDGDPDDTVHTSDRYHSGTAYHDDPECGEAATVIELREQRRETAQRRGRYPCQSCVLGERYREGGSMDAYQALADADPDDYAAGGDA